MKSIIIFCLTFLTSFSVFGKEQVVSVEQTTKAVDSTFELLYTIPLQSTYLTTDNLQNLYLATETGAIVKYDNKGKEQFIYNNQQLGLVGKIDAKNPFNILVYYPDFEVVIILDRTLSVISELNLFDLGIIEPKGIGIANDNNIWIFDQVTSLLKKIDQKGKVLFESRNLNQLTQKAITPLFLLEQNNLLWLSDAENGVLVFDTFGQFKQTILVKGIHQFQVLDQQLIYWKAGQLFYMDTLLLEEKTIEVPVKSQDIKEVTIQGDILFITKKESIEVYKWKN